MAVTWTTTIIHETVFGNKRVVTADIEATGTSTVTAVGDAYAPSALGLRGFDIVMMSGFSLSNTGGATQTAAQSVTAADTGYFPVYNYTQESISTHMLGPADLAAVGPSVVATGVNITGAKIRIMAVGY
jgi:hypothetical protein